METCPLCGAPAFTRMLDGVPTQFEPMALDLVYYTLSERNTAIRGGAMRLHRCNIEAVRAFQTDQETKAAVFNESIERAMELHCSKCDARPGQECINLVDRSRAKRWPHDERLRAAITLMLSNPTPTQGEPDDPV